MTYLTVMLRSVAIATPVTLRCPYLPSSRFLQRVAPGGRGPRRARLRVGVQGIPAPPRKRDERRRRVGALSTRGENPASGTGQLDVRNATRHRKAWPSCSAVN